MGKIIPLSKNHLTEQIHIKIATAQDHMLNTAKKLKANMLKNVHSKLGKIFIGD